jgi:hypothetical protein
MGYCKKIEKWAIANTLKKEPGTVNNIVFYRSRHDVIRPGMRSWF